MTTLILDASVAAKWVLPEEGQPLAAAAASLLSHYAADQLRFVVPDLFWAEFGNLLWKAAQHGRLSAESAAVAIEGVRARRFPTVSSFHLMPAALRIANFFERPVYDGIYAALAIETNADWVTADERLAAAFAARLPVKWLGAF